MPRPVILANAGLDDTLPAWAPFVGRTGLLRRLHELHRTGRHVLLVGEPGSGKSVLLAEFARTHPLIVISHCDCIGRVLDSIEPATGIALGKWKMAERLHQAVAWLNRDGRAVVFENAVRVPPKVAHLIRKLLVSQPVWLVARSVQAMDIGHVWPYLFFFQRVDLPPFTLAETRAFLAATKLGWDQCALQEAAARLHRLAAGHPGTLAALVAEMRARAYDIHTAAGLRLLALNARITQAEEMLGVAPRI